MQKPEILKSIADAGLSRVLPDIQRLLQESIRLNLLPTNQSILPVGESHLGGLPDIPEAFTWPTWHNLPMSFIAQVQLEKIYGFAPAKGLPAAGLISFFYDARQDTYGASPSDRGGWGVYYFDPGISLHTATAPEKLPEEALFPAHALSFTSEFTLPTSAAQHIQNLDWSEAEVNRYEDFLFGFPTPEDHSRPHHRMFGHPDQIQDDMQLQCTLYANGIPTLDDPRAAGLVEKKEDWLLLLQVDSDARTGMKWATSGMLYFWLDSAALSLLKLDQTWLVLQAE
jgi:uncharacterized protein YwqG